MARTIRERMNVRDNEVFTPIDLINAKHYLLLSTLSLEQTSCLSSMDQTNPSPRLRTREDYLPRTRWTSRERAGFEVRRSLYALDVYVQLKLLRDQTLV
jgi:DNA-directed RNA polymerase subunit beta